MPRAGATREKREDARACTDVEDDVAGLHDRANRGRVSIHADGVREHRAMVIEHGGRMKDEG
jgi:hypothetical protein